MRVAGAVLLACGIEPAADRALAEAAAIARSAHVPLVMCHVLDDASGFLPLSPEQRIFDPYLAAENRAWALDAMQRQVERVIAPSAAQPELRVDPGEFVAVLTSVAAEVQAGLIVVNGALPVDSAAARVRVERIARTAHCPVLHLLADAGRCVLAATDFSDPATPAVRAAHDEAVRLGLPLFVLHAVETVTPAFGLPDGGSPPHVSALLDARRAVARSRLEGVWRRFSGARTVLWEGAATESIIAAGEALDAARIVIGTHGRSALHRLANGSVAEGVLRRTRRSTLVVPLAHA
ncbi:MAG TPA: universal stress protein [Dongiaceae bacterium]|nr:universal stress protein [Dongiaceae bacterium]